MCHGIPISIATTQWDECSLHHAQPPLTLPITVCWSKNPQVVVVAVCCVLQDLTYQPGSAKKDEDRKQRKQRKRDRLLSNSSSSGRDAMPLSVTTAVNTVAVMPVNGMMRSQRTHRLSMSSTGSSSSPPSSAGTTPCTPSGHFMPQMKKNKFEFFADAEQAAAGNIFRHRTDLAAFGALPRHLQVSKMTMILLSEDDKEFVR